MPHLLILQGNKLHEFRDPKNAIFKKSDLAQPFFVNYKNLVFEEYTFFFRKTDNC